MYECLYEYALNIIKLLICFLRYFDKALGTDSELMTARSAVVKPQGLTPARPCTILFRRDLAHPGTVGVWRWRSGKSQTCDAPFMFHFATAVQWPTSKDRTRHTGFYTCRLACTSICKSLCKLWQHTSDSSDFSEPSESWNLLQQLLERGDFGNLGMLKNARNFFRGWSWLSEHLNWFLIWFSWCSWVLALNLWMYLPQGTQSVGALFSGRRLASLAKDILDILLFLFGIVPSPQKTILKNDPLISIDCLYEIWILTDFVTGSDRDRVPGVSARPIFMAALAKESRGYGKAGDKTCGNRQSLANFCCRLLPHVSPTDFAVWHAVTLTS